MSVQRSALVDSDRADDGDRALALASELRDRIARDRATAQALREYLQARATPLGDRSAAVPAASPTPTCVRDARAYARRCCAEHHVEGDRCDTMELAVSELLGNAVRHGHPPVAYDIAVDGDDLVLTVSDGNPAGPVAATDRGPDAEQGRGLFLISEMARGWGWEQAKTGKRVWVRV